MAGLTSAISFFSAPGAPVIVPTPAYMPFFTVPPWMGREVLEVPMARDGDRYVYDLDALDAAYRAGGSLLVLCNPHNPIGRVLERSELVAVSEVVERHGGRVFSDEIHAPLVYDGHVHVPYATVSEAAASHTVTAVSASKAWNLPGLKCAQLVLGERRRRGALVRGRVHGRARRGQPRRGRQHRGLRRGRPVAGRPGGLPRRPARVLLGDLLAEHLPEVGYRPPEGTYLAWLDCRRLGLGDHPAEFFLEHAGVALTDGPACGAVGAGFARLNFATPRPVLEQTVRQLAAALDAR